MSKRETPPSPYSEATVVQTRNPAPPPSPEKASRDAHQPEGSERTVVQGRSNLKETFDAHTVVRTSSSFPPEMPSPPRAAAPQIPEAPPRYVEPTPVAAAAPVAKPAAVTAPVAKEQTNPVFEQTGGAVQISAAVVEEKPAKKAKKEKVPREPRAPRKPLDQRSKILIASFAVVAVLALVFVMGGTSTSETSASAAQTNGQAATPDEGQKNLASEQPGQPDQPKFQQLPGPPAATTADVLNRFDKASARAQERAEQYSRSGGGF